MIYHPIVASNAYPWQQLIKEPKQRR